MDYSLVGAAIWWFVTTFGETNAAGESVVSGLKALPVPAFWFVYFPLAESLSGATLGKFLFGLRVLDLSGSRLALWLAVKRRFVDVLDFHLTFGSVALILATKNPSHQRLGDIVAQAKVCSVS